MADQIADLWARAEKSERSQRTKLTLKDLGQPSNVKSMSPEELAKNKGKYITGWLVGKVRDFIERTSVKDGEVFEGLAGTFMMVPSDENREVLESGVLFIPDAFHNLIAAKLREIRKTDETAECEFAFEVSSIAANNPAGYSWNFLPIIPFEGAHPLQATFGKVKLSGPGAQKALPGAAKK